MRITRAAWPGYGFRVQCVIPKSVKYGVPFRRQKTFRIRCIRPDLVQPEIEKHLQTQINQWRDKVLASFHDDKNQTSPREQAAPLPGV